VIQLGRTSQARSAYKNAVVDISQRACHSPACSQSDAGLCLFTGF